MTELNTPWTLRFGTDGLANIATIRDAEGEVLVTSRHFWLPEGDDPIPPTLASMKVMVAAPKILLALADLLDQIKGIGIADWQGAEGLCLKQAETILAELGRETIGVEHEAVA